MLLPQSNRLTAITPTGPRKPWAKGMAKLPMLQPEALSMANAWRSLPWGRYIAEPTIIISTPKQKPIRVSSSMEVCISRPEKFVTIAAVRVILITILLSTWKSLSLKNPTRRSAQPNRMMPIKHPACVRISTTVSPSLSLKLHDILLFVYIILCTCRQVILRPNRIIFLRQPSCIYGSKRLFYKYHKPYHFLRAGFSGTQHTERTCILIWLVQQFWLAEKLLMMALP